MRTFIAILIGMLFATSARAESTYSTGWSTLIASKGAYVLDSQLPTSSTGTGAYGTATALWHDPVSGTDWAAVGAPLENSGAGAVYIYCRNAGAAGWVWITEVAPYDSAPNSAFGAAVALDGDTLVVGAPLHVSDFTVGAAYVIVRDSATGAWVQQAELIARSGEFGLAVAVSGDQLAVADPSLNRVYPYERSGSTWNALPPIEALSDMLLPSFGASLWMSDTELLIGAPTDSALLVDQGSSALYAKSRDSWDLQQILRPQIDTSGFQFFGQSVAKSDRGIFIGSPRTSASKGAFNIFLYDTVSALWVQQSKVLEPTHDTGMTPLPLFGYSLATSGDILVVGTPGRDRATVFRYTSGTWLPDSTLTGNTGSGFGLSVATAGDNVLVGAPGDGDKGEGAAYIFVDDRIFADGFGN